MSGTFIVPFSKNARKEGGKIIIQNELSIGVTAVSNMYLYCGEIESSGIIKGSIIIFRRQQILKMMKAVQHNERGRVKQPQQREKNRIRTDDDRG